MESSSRSASQGEAGQTPNRGVDSQTLPPRDRIQKEVDRMGRDANERENAYDPQRGTVQ